MEQVKRNKSRTAITINPQLWDRAKRVCADLTISRERKISFSQLVEEALLAYLGAAETEGTETE
jgi:hypothetical protein